MTEKEVYAKALETISEEEIEMYRPAIFETDPDGFLGGVSKFVPNTIMIWLKNGDTIWYRADDE